MFVYIIFLKTRTAAFNRLLNATRTQGLCAAWGAIVLLDEADALVERREKGQLLLNSLVGVLLRTLDRFEGQLFLTTNRAKQFDPAAISRVTLAIRVSAGSSVYEFIFFNIKKTFFSLTHLHTKVGAKCGATCCRASAPTFNRSISSGSARWRCRAAK